LQFIQILQFFVIVLLLMMSLLTVWSIDFCVRAQQFWQQGDPAPSLAFIPALSRRRLSPLARIALALAYELSAESKPERMVFASRHGEIINTTAMLRDLAQDIALSPAAFSHAVHNAIPGLWSIFQQQHGECSAIAAGLDTLPMALLEAQTLLFAEPKSAVLLLLADEMPPACFESGLTELSAQYALGLLLDAGPANLRLTAVSDAQSMPIAPPAALGWQAWRLSDSTAPFWQSGERHAWRWDKLAQLASAMPDENARSV
jgi:hypothetical protein